MTWRKALYLFLIQFDHFSQSFRLKLPLGTFLSSLCRSTVLLCTEILSVAKNLTENSVDSAMWHGLLHRYCVCLCWSVRALSMRSPFQQPSCTVTVPDDLIISNLSTTEKTVGSSLIITSLLMQSDVNQTGGGISGTQGRSVLWRDIAFDLLLCGLFGVIESEGRGQKVSDTSNFSETISANLSLILGAMSDVLVKDTSYILTSSSFCNESVLWRQRLWSVYSNAMFHALKGTLLFVLKQGGTVSHILPIASRRGCLMALCSTAASLPKAMLLGCGGDLMAFVIEALEQNMPNSMLSQAFGISNSTLGASSALNPSVGYGTGVWKVEKKDVLISHALGCLEATLGEALDMVEPYLNRVIPPLCQVR